MPALRQLTLENCDFEGGTLAELAACKSLSKLTLRDCKISADGLRDLAETKPNLVFNLVDVSVDPAVADSIALEGRLFRKEPGSRVAAKLAVEVGAAEEAARRFGLVDPGIYKSPEPTVAFTEKELSPTNRKSGSEIRQAQAAVQASESVKLRVKDAGSPGFNIDVEEVMHSMGHWIARRLAAQLSSNGLAADGERVSP